MIQPDSVPEATAPPEHHADFLEFSALRSHNQRVSFQEFVRDLRIGNAAEVVADSAEWDADGNGGDTGNYAEAEAIAQAAFDEVDERQRNFGVDAAQYPFENTGNSVSLRTEGEQSLYTFLSLLSWFGKDAGPSGTDGEKIFEEVCAKAGEAYLGGPSHRVRSFVFGFPRRVHSKGFAAALDSLCASLGEGGGHRKGRPKLPDQKDAKLDLVIWVEFHDSRHGKMITFGQCATGRNWDHKLSELPSPDLWCGHWMADAPTVLPVRSFFVPHRIERDLWTYKCTFGGILFDRCRIASLASETSGETKTNWMEWSAHVLDAIRGT
jgi:hypothetical protein